MKKLRILGDGRSHYHCISRVHRREFIFDDTEKRHFKVLMRKLEAFLGVRVVTYCIMSNHFHLLLEVPDKESMTSITKDELLELLPVLYSKATVKEVRQELARAEGHDEWIQEIVERYESRRGRLDIFMKDLKQRFTQWYNKRNGLRGTLWEDRYRSVLVEDNENTLMTMAAYIDLNPVRARMVDDPADYKWSGYGEAMAGNQKAREGLGFLLENALQCEGFNQHKPDWRRTGGRYRVLLYQHGEERSADEITGQRGRAGFSKEKVEAVTEAKGKVPVTTILRCRVRYFCDGAVFGTSDFVDSIFARTRERLGLKRDVGPREMKGGVRWGDLRVMRDLRGMAD